MLAALDVCFGLVWPYQHRIANMLITELSFSICLQALGPTYIVVGIIYLHGVLFTWVKVALNPSNDLEALASDTNNTVKLSPIE